MSWSAVRNKFQKLGPWIAIFLIALMVNFRIIFTPGLIIHGDVKFPWDILNLVETGEFLFSEKNGFVSSTEVMGRWFTLHLLTKLVCWMGYGTETLVKIIFFFTTLLSLAIFYIFGSWVSSDIIRKNVNQYWLVFLSVFFTFSPWILYQIQAWGYWLAYILTPAIIYFGYRWMDSKKFIYMLLLVLTCTFLSTGPQYLFYTFLLLVIFFTLYVFLSRGSICFNLLIKQALSGVILFFILSLPWVLPILSILISGSSFTTGYGQNGMPDVTRELIREFGKNATTLNVFSGFDQWISWFFLDQDTTFQKVIRIFPFFTFLAACLFIRKNPHIVLITVFVSTVFFGALALGANLPGYVEIATLPLVVDTFGFVFRTPYKLSYFIFIGFSVALITFYANLSSFYHRSILVLLILVYFFSVPFIKTMYFFWEYYVPISQPVAYSQLYSFINDRRQPFDRAVWTAPYGAGLNRNKLKWEASFTWNPERNAQHTPETSSSIGNISYWHISFKQWVRPIFSQIEPWLVGEKLDPAVFHQIGSNLLIPVGVRYLIYHNDIVGGLKYGRSIIKLLDKSDLKRVANFSEGLAGGEIVVYEVSEEPLYFRVAANSQRLEFDKIDPTRYSVHLNGMGDMIVPFVMDSYWRLETPDGKVILPKEDTTTGLCIFEIPLGISGKANLYYLPQSYYEVGIVISGIAMMLSILSCLIYWIHGILDSDTFFRNRNRQGDKFKPRWVLTRMKPYRS